MKSAAALMFVGVLLAACGDDPTSPTDKTTTASSKAPDDTSSDDTSTTSTTNSAPITATPKKGAATFYSATGAGACSFDASPNDLDVAAMQVPEFEGSNACGTCLFVTGPKASVTVRVTDDCPGCAAKNVDLDLSAQAFAKIADPVAGHIDITFAQVPCEVTGPITYHFKDGASKFWTAIQVLNYKVPVAKLEYSNNGTWTEIDRLSYNYFVVAKGVGDQPNGLSLRVTSSDNQVLEDTLSGTITADTTESGHAQFN